LVSTGFRLSRPKIKAVLRENAVIFLILSFVPGLFVRLQVFKLASNYTVSYGNTAAYMSWADLLLKNGALPLWEPSYGGKPSLQLPIYGLFLSLVARIFGGDVIAASNAMVVISTIAPIGLALITWAITKNPYYSVLTVLISESSSLLTVYAGRPIPQFLGMLLLPMALFFFFRRNYIAASIISVLTALTHQLSAVVLVFTFALYLIIASALTATKRLDPPLHIREAAACLGLIVLPILSYLAWQVALTGNSNILMLAQNYLHDSVSVDLNLWLQIGYACLTLGFLGLALVLGEGASRVPALMIAWTIACILCTENQILAPIAPSVFPFMNDRFLAFLPQPLSVLAALGLFDMINEKYAFALRRKNA